MSTSLTENKSIIAQHVIKRREQLGSLNGSAPSAEQLIGMSSGIIFAVRLLNEDLGRVPNETKERIARYMADTIVYFDSLRTKGIELDGIRMTPAIVDDQRVIRLIVPNDSLRESGLKPGGELVLESPAIDVARTMYHSLRPWESVAKLLDYFNPPSLRQVPEIMSAIASLDDEVPIPQRVNLIEQLLTQAREFSPIFSHPRFVIAHEQGSHGDVLLFSLVGRDVPNGGFMQVAINMKNIPTEYKRQVKTFIANAGGVSDAMRRGRENFPSQT